MPVSNEDEVFSNLFEKSPPERQFRISLLWLLLMAGIMPAVIYVVTISGPTVAREAPKILPSIPPAKKKSRDDWNRLRQTPLWEDWFPFCAMTFMVVAISCGAAMVALESDVAKFAAPAIVILSGAVVLISVILCVCNGAGNTTVVSAHGQDYFVVYVSVIAVGAAIGAGVGGKIAGM